MALGHLPRREAIFEIELEPDPVLDVIVGEHEPVRRERPRRPDQVLLEPNAGEIAEPHRRDAQDADRNRELSPQCGLDGCLIPQVRSARHRPGGWRAPVILRRGETAARRRAKRSQPPSR